MDIQLRRIYAMLDKQGINLSISDNVKDWLAERGYDPVYGARPLKRLIQTKIIDKLATELIRREEDIAVEFEATLSKGGEDIEFAEVFNDAEAWAG